MPIRKAVVPAAGRGTRMRPFTEVVPKELVPLGSRPALDLVIEEAHRAELTEVAVVVGREKDALGAYLAHLERSGAYPSISFEIVVQPAATGLADAITLCRAFTAGEPFALLLPDNVLLSPDHRLRPLLDLADETGAHAVGVVELAPEHSGQYGRSGLFEGEELRPGVFHITGLAGKEAGRLTVPPGRTLRRACGRYVCQPELFAILEELRRNVDGELDEVPAYQQIAAAGRLYGHLLPQPLFDVGHPRGFLAANAYLHRRGAAEG